MTTIYAHRHAAIPTPAEIRAVRAVARGENGASVRARRIGIIRVEGEWYCPSGAILTTGAHCWDSVPIP